MGVTFGGYPCLAPEIEVENCARHGYPLGEWAARANGFRTTLGQKPGQGWILLLRKHLEEQGLDTPADLVFAGDQDDTRLPLLNLHIVRAGCVCPGQSKGENDRGRDDPDTAFWCELADRRRIIARSVIDSAYNLRSTPAAVDYFSATLNGGDPWTWEEMLEDIWDNLGIEDEFPGLPLLADGETPFVPDGTPEGFDFYGGNAWDALGTVLERISCAIDLDPLTDTFSIVRLSDDDADMVKALKAANGLRIWDGEPKRSVLGKLPEFVRVLFPKHRFNFDTTGGSHWYVLDVTDPEGTSEGVEPGTYETVKDTLPAQYDEADALTNAAELADRAAERAADWFRRAKQQLRNRSFTGLRKHLGTGSQVQGVCWEERGRDQGPVQRGFQTHIFSDNTAEVTEDCCEGDNWQLLSWLHYYYRESYLTVEDDLLTVVVTQVNTIQFEYGSFVVTDLGGGVAHISLGCLTARRIEGPPPWGPPDDPACCDGWYTDGKAIGMWFCATESWFMLCECPPDDHGSGSSGSGTGTVICTCTHCPDGAPYEYVFQQLGAVGDFADANGEWRIAYVSGCLWSQTRGIVTCTLDYDTGLADWLLTFEANGRREVMRPFRTSFLCCGETRFVEVPLSAGLNVGLDLANHTSDFADVAPDGPCHPCGGGGDDGACCDDLEDTYYVTFHGGTGGCTCLDSVPEFPITRTGNTWYGSYTTSCGVGPDITSDVALGCTAAGWALSSLDPLGSRCFSAAVLVSKSCSPLELDFEATAEAACCLGTIQIAIRE